jgi:hypothetical protein
MISVHAPRSVDRTRASESADIERQPTDLPHWTAGSFHRAALLQAPAQASTEMRGLVPPPMTKDEIKAPREGMLKELSSPPRPLRQAPTAIYEALSQE